MNIPIARDGSSLSILPLIKSASGDLLLRDSLMNLATSLAMVGVMFSLVHFDTFAGDEYGSRVVTEEIVTFGLNVL